MATQKLLAILALLLTAACEAPPEFVATLSDQGETEFDVAILGQWYQPVEDGAILYVSIADAAQAHRDAEDDDNAEDTAGVLLRISMILQDTKNQEALNLPFTAFPSRLDGALYYNVAHARSQYAWDVTVPDQPPGHYIVRVFNPTPDIMLVCLLSEFPEDGQQTGGLTARSVTRPIELNGQPLQNGDDWEHKFVDGSRADLRRYVGSDPARQFVPVLYLTRLSTTWLAPDHDPLQVSRINQYRGDCAIDEFQTL